MRINQFVASSSGLSRRAADAAVAAGRVRINGQLATLGQTVDVSDFVALDDQPLTLISTHIYLMLNKPVGFVSSRVRQGTGQTLYELLPERFHKLRIAGRLDRDSSGLIILTSDGNFIQNLTHPSSDKLKTYELTLSAPISATDRTKLEHGVLLKDGPSRIRIVAATGRSLTVTIGEGRNRQLRRTFGALGYRIDRLHRTHIGSFNLGDLPSGTWTEIDSGTIKL
jgi:16S rRNA pseudouridine516 synthase